MSISSYGTPQTNPYQLSTVRGRADAQQVPDRELVKHSTQRALAPTRHSGESGNQSKLSKVLRKLGFLGSGRSRQSDSTTFVRSTSKDALQCRVSKLTDKFERYLRGSGQGRTSPAKILATLCDADCLIMDAVSNDIEVDKLAQYVDFYYEQLSELTISPDLIQLGDKKTQNEIKALCLHVDRVMEKYVRRACNCEPVNRLGLHLDIICDKFGHVFTEELMESINHRRTAYCPSSEIRHCAPTQILGNAQVGAMPIHPLVGYWSNYLQKHFCVFPEPIHPQDSLTLPHLKSMLRNATNAMEMLKRANTNVTELEREIDQCHQSITGKRYQMMEYYQTLKNQIGNRYVDQHELLVSLNSVEQNLKRFDALFLEIRNPAASEQVERLRNHFNFPQKSISISSGIEMTALKDMLKNATATMAQQKADGMDVTILQDEISRCHQLILDKGAELHNQYIKHQSFINDPTWDQSSLLNYLDFLDKNSRQFNAVFWDALPIEIRYVMDSITSNSLAS